MLLIFLEILFVVLALLSALFWWLSSRVTFDNEAGTTAQSAMGEHLFNVADPDELASFLSKQSKWNSNAALSAAGAAIVGVVIGLLFQGDTERSPHTVSNCEESASIPEAMEGQIK